MQKASLIRSLFARFRSASPLSAPTPEELARETAFKDFFIARCTHFRLLLAANKTALEGMTKLESMLSDAAQPDPLSARDLCLEIAAKVEDIVVNLTALADNAYPALAQRLQAIVADMHASLDILVPPALAAHIDESSAGEDIPLSVRFGTQEAVTAEWCGSKMAGLARYALHPPLPYVMAPPGFITTVQAFALFMESEELGKKIAGLLDELQAKPQLKSPEKAEVNQELVRLHRIATTIRDRIMKTPLPQQLEQCILSEVVELEQRNPGCALAVRSSALDEDSFENSFAGQYKSLLHVPPADAVQAWKEVVASLYGVNVLSYRANRRLGESGACVMCVGFLVMLEVEAGGVAYSADPLDQQNPDCIVNAVAGLPGAVVDGSATPDLFRISPGPPLAVRSRHSGQGENAPASISDEQALAVAQLALTLQAEQGCAQDVEWAFDTEGVLNLLQSRPLARGTTPELSAENEEALEKLPQLLSGGIIASQGVASGTAHLVQNDRDMARFPQKGVLVVNNALPKWAPLLHKTSALISEAGGTASHLASVAREYGVPALFGMQGFIALLRAQEQPNPQLTVDARKGIVYLGDLPAGFSILKQRSTVMDSPLRRNLKAVTDIVLPLNLLDPEAEEFSPAGCRTLHDITRFCHEKSVESLFNTQLEGRGETEPPGRQLKAGVKLKYWLVDMGGGFSEPIHTPYVDIRHIRSLPMLALWNGMISIPWAGPPAPDGRGFLSVVARSASNPELDPLAANSMAEKNYFLISRTFCNLQTRIGYHFCTVEAEAGEVDHANYASFHFKGGAASLDRRALRIRLMADILQEHGFTASAQRDALSAHTEDASQKNILEKTRILGYLLIHTRQVDMIMRNANMVSSLNKKLRDDIQKLVKMPFQLPH
ncbi:MAG: phosphoenolpyruvate synthase [Deltaproteobacteria bacterium]|jgi:pyruvate,water dikinase|nr:phosphoenolpyruvate synthase [Deltaproteobacteria bacterium]